MQVSEQHSLKWNSRIGFWRRLGRVSDIRFGWYWCFCESQDIEACRRFGKPDRDKSQKTIVRRFGNINCTKILLNKKKLSSIDCSKHYFTENTQSFAIENLTPMNESIAWTAKSWSAVVSFMVASRGMELLELNVGKKINLLRFSTWIRFMGFFLKFILVMPMTRMTYFLMPHK